MDLYTDKFNEMLSKSNLDSLDSDYEKALYLQRNLINRSTDDGPANEEHYIKLRKYFMSRSDTREKLPSWVKNKRNFNQFWSFIKNKFPSYAERREFIYEEFNHLLEYLETNPELPYTEELDKHLENLNSDYIMSIWNKALKRKTEDPDGAVTISRTLLEGVLKHILDDFKKKYSSNPSIHSLYKKVANELNLSPEQHSEEVFKQILGGCSGIVSGIGSIRNAFGDSHGQGKKNYKPDERLAKFAINISSSICLFLLQTYERNLNE